MAGGAELALLVHPLQLTSFECLVLHFLLLYVLVQNSLLVFGRYEFLIGYFALFPLQLSQVFFVLFQISLVVQICIAAFIYDFCVYV